MRHLVLVLGDQLDRRSSAFDGFDPAHDRVWMAEVAGEATHVWSTKPRIAVFLAAMRHFRDRLRGEGLTVDYRELPGAASPAEPLSLGAALAASLAARRPRRLVVVEPGEHRVEEELRRVAAEADIPLEIRPDRHFFATKAEFTAHTAGRKQLRQEWWYRELRSRHGVLMDGDEPAGGQWNFDAENRGSFPKSGPGTLPAPRRFAPDAVTRGVLDLVNARFARHPGRLDAFDWPVTPEDARLALDDFLGHRLVNFGRYQDAIWTGEPWLWHSRLSAAMNLKLLDPRDVVAGAERSWRGGSVPIEAAEGFIRQVLGWREYVRGVYWHLMPEYAGRNALGAEHPLPGFYWTGETEMACLRDAVRQSLAGSMNMMGNFGGALSPVVVPWLLARLATGGSDGANWTPAFLLFAAVYAVGGVAWLFIDPVTPLEEDGGAGA